jgi:hypothetical protein
VVQWQVRRQNMTRKPCDDAFDRDEKAFWRTAEKLLGSARTCIRQAGSDLARACRLFRDDNISQLGALLVENLKGLGNFDNVLGACRLFTSGRRGSLNHASPSPEDLITISALYLEDACEHLLADGMLDLPAVGPDTFRSRAASEEILKVLKHRV